MSAVALFRKKIDALAAASPEVAPYLAAVSVALAEFAEPTWSGAVADLASPAPSPLLAGARIAIGPRALARFIETLFDAALRSAPGGRRDAAKRALRAPEWDPLALVAAAVDGDAARLERIAMPFGEASPSVPALAQLAAVPLLQAQRKAHAALLPALWPDDGHCALCGALPTMAELRGLERRRRLRCGRCGADGEAPALGCPFCGERDHRRLASLLPEKGGESRKADACDGCGAYLKTLTTLVGWPGEMVLLEDLATIDLDLAAADRGRARPADEPFSPGVTLVPAPERRGLFGLFS